MENLFIYFIKACGLIGLFYFAYILLLRKETFFNSNRWFLLAGLITAAILPLFFITKIIWVEPTPTNIDWATIQITTTAIKKEIEINWYLFFAIIYVIGFLFLTIKFLLDLYSLKKVLQNKTVQQHSDFKFINVRENIAPFSFFNYIVYNSELYNKTELDNILEHEKVHGAQNHTLDVLISRLFTIIFWFNPFIWLYKKAMIQNLEFIADNEASKKIADKKAYQMTLLKITTYQNCIAITNHFYQSLIKKRIIMLNQNQSNQRNSWKYAAIVPALI
ncbi:MAG: M56 family metallopeptidase, partial [Flavobacterium sp.]